MANFVLNPVVSRINSVVAEEVGDQIPHRGNPLTRALACLILAFLGWRIIGELPNAPRQLLIVAPHTSNWDMGVGVLVMYALGIRVSFMAKHSLFRWPVASLMRWLGGVPVQRHTSQGLVGQMVDVYAQRGQFCLAILPEGTRRRVAQWKLGFYHIAMKAGVPLVPVKFDYGRKVIELAPTFPLSGDLDEDLPRIQRQFKGVRGKILHNSAL